MIAIGVGANSRAHEEDFAAAISGLRREVKGGDIVATFSDATFAAFVEAAANREAITYRAISLEKLRARSDDCLTQSERTLERFSIASVAEASALVAAGPKSRLVVPRRVIGNITVAAACSAEGVS